MTDKSSIENRISAARKYLKILERYKKLPRAEIEGSIDLRGAVERYLYLAIQSTIDLAEALISHRGYRKPSTFGETFRILSEEDLIPKDLGERLAKMVGFRNIIAHDYGDIDYGIVCQILAKDIDDVKLFLDIASRTI